MIGAFVLISAVSFVMVASFYLAWHKHYHSGLIGTVGLAMICIGSTARLSYMLDRCFQSEYLCEMTRVNPAILFLWVGLALFMGRLLHGFLQRVKCKDERSGGWYA